jgi:hypothetical protein
MDPAMTFLRSPFRRAEHAPARRAHEHLFAPQDLDDLEAAAVTSAVGDESIGPAPEAPALEPERTAVEDLDPAPVISSPARVRREHPYRGAVLLALVLLALAAVMLVAAAEVLRGIEQGVGWLLAWDNEYRRVLVATALIALAILALIVAWGRATSRRRPVRLSAGRGRIAVDAIASQLRAAIEAHPDIRRAEVQVENRHRSGLRVDVRLHVGAQARIDDTLDAVDDAAEEIVQRRLGVALDGAPLVDVTYEELDLRAGRAHDRSPITRTA